MIIQDSINAEIDRRKIQDLIKRGIVTEEEIAIAPIYFLCECGQEQDPLNDNCINCGKDIR